MLDIEAVSEVYEESLDVIAWYHGCFPALALAARSPPSNWRTLVLIAPGLKGREYVSTVPLWTARTTQKKQAWLESALRMSYDVTGPQTSELAAIWSRDSPLDEGLDAVVGFELSASIASIGLPSLVITDDLFREPSECVADLIPGARLAVTDRLYHSAAQGRWLRSQIDEFLAGLEGDAVRAPSVLSSRENEIVAHLAKGATNQGIADHLQISVRTVERHIQNILNKLGLHNRVEIAYWAMRNGLLD